MGAISLTTGDSRRGSLGAIFRFLGLRVCLAVQRGLSRVLIKYSGNVRLQKLVYITSALLKQGLNFKRNCISSTSI